MKKLILCLALTGLFTSSTKISSAVPVESRGNYSDVDTSGYQKFKIDAKREIKENEDRIARFREKMNAKTGQAKATLKVKIDSLEAKNRRLDDELTQYTEDAKGGAKRDWHTFKKKFNNEMDKLKKSFDDIKKDMK